MEKKGKIKKSWYRISFREDRTILLACVGIAFIFWLFVKLSKDYTSEKTFRVAYELPPELAFVTTPPDQVKAFISGRGWDLLWVSLFRKRSRLNYEVRQEGSVQIPRTNLMDRIGKQIGTQVVQVEGINMDFLSLRTGAFAKKKVPVHSTLRLGFAPGYAASDSLLLIPDSVTLSGASSNLQPVARWETEPLVFPELRKDLSAEVPLRTPENPMVVVEPQIVRADLPVEALTEKTLFVPIQVVQEGSDSISLFPRQVQLKVVVGMSRFSSLTAEDFRALADLREVGLSSGENTAPVVVDQFPPGVKITGMTPKSVEFFLIQPSSEGDEGEATGGK